MSNLIDDKEIWKPIFINGEKTKYEISSLGRVMSYAKNSIRLKPSWDNGHGYQSLLLYFKGKLHSRKNHRLVAQAFLENPNNLPEVNHKNGIKTDNRVENLEWVDKKTNSKHAASLGYLYRGRRKLPPMKVGKYFAGILLKTYPSMSSVVKDNYPRVSVARACKSGKNYKGFFWKTL